MKKIIFFLSQLFVLFLSAESMAQVSYTITAPSSFTICGQRQTVTIDLATTSVLSNQTFSIDFDVMGLRLYNPVSTDANMSFPAFTEGSNVLNVALSTLTSTSQLKVDVFAGCNVSNPFNLQTLPATIQVKDNGGTIKKTQGITIYANQNGALLLPESQDPSSNQSGNAGDELVRTIVIQNTTSSTFSGFINVNDNLDPDPLNTLASLGLTTAIDIKKIQIIYSNGEATQIINNNTPIELNPIAPNDFITIKETIKINQCINATPQGQSSMTIQVGCTIEDLCNAHIYPLVVTKATSIPILTRATNFFRDKPYWTCFNESALNNVSFDFINTGSVTANGINFSFLPAYNHYTESNSFEVEIIGVDGKSIMSSGRVLMNHPFLPSEGIYGNINGYALGNNEDTRLEYYRDVIWGTSDPRQHVLFQSCGTSDFLVSRVISDYVDALNVERSISLKPGERVRLKWKDKHCCFDSRVTTHNQYNITKPFIKGYLKNCTGVFYQVTEVMLSDRIEFHQDVLPYDPGLNGNPDKCLATNDGETRVVKIQNKNASYGLLPDDHSTWGDLVIDLVMDRGVDLDITLNGTALYDDSYNYPIDEDLTNDRYNGSCGGASCANTCTAPRMSISDLQRYQIKFIDDASGVVLEWKPSTPPTRISNTQSGSTYRIAFSYIELQSLLTKLNMPWTAASANLLVSRMRLEFKVRSSCPASDAGELTTVTEKIYYSSNKQLCNTDCLMPLYMQHLDFMIVCPGCETPGANLLTCSLKRESQFLGLKDDNNDGIPDAGNAPIDIQLLKVNCMNGDELEGMATIFLSDGGPGGFYAHDLTNQGVHLDNVYVFIDPTISGILETNSSVAKVSIDQINWKEVPFISNQDGTFQLQLKSSDLSGFTGYFNDAVEMNIYVQYKLRVKRKNNINNSLEKSKLVMVKSKAYFSDIDDHFSNPESSWQDAKGNLQCNWSGSCDIINKYYYFCSSNATLINYIPVATHVSKGSLDGLTNSCNPKMWIKWGASSYGINSFNNEYRSYIESNDNSILNYTIPSGFKVSSLTITNAVDIGRTITRSEDIGNYFTLDNEAKINQAINSGIISILGNSLTVNVKHEVLTSTSILGSMSGLYSGQAIRVADDNFFIQCQITLSPIDCKNTPFESFYYNGPVGSISYPSAYTLIDHPTVSLPLLPNTIKQTAIAYTGSSGYYNIHRPDTELGGTVTSPVYLSQDYFYIPITLNNTDPTDILDGIGYPVKDIQGGIYRSVNANNPFLFLTNKDALETLGYKVKGVYENKVDASNISSVGTNFYNAINGIAPLKKNGQNYIPASSSDNVYTMVVEYKCPTGCDPMLQSVNSSDSELPECLKLPKQLLIKYGWNCNAYPTSEAEINAACDVKDLKVVDLITPSVYLDVKAKLNNNAPVALCQTFPYEVSLQSTKIGNIKELNLELQLPPNVELVSSSYMTTMTAPGVYAIFNITAGAPFSTGMIKTLSFVLRLKTYSSDQLTIVSKVSGATYCASTFPSPTYSGIISSTTTIQPPILGINAAAKYCINAPNVSLTTTIPGGVFTPMAGLVDNGNGSATFSPALAGAGTHVITYTVNAPEVCVATKTIEVISIPTITTTIPNALCLGSSPVVLSSSPVGATFSGTGVSVNAGLYTFKANATGAYVVSYTYTTTEGCVVSGSKTIQIDNFTVSINASQTACLGEAVVLTATPSTSLSSSATYTWYKTVGGVRQLPALSGPAVSNTYTYNNINSATTFEVELNNGSGCLVTATHSITLNTPDACCLYKLGDITVNCSTSTQNICVPLTAVRNVPSGIIGMDFCLKYDPTIMSYTGPTGSITSNNLGTVVTNGGLFGATYATYNDAVNGKLRVSIYYSGSGSGLASFKGSGEIICLNFSIPSSTSRQGVYPIAMCTVNDLQEAYTLDEKAACWKAGSLIILLPDIAKGRLLNPLYGNTIQGQSSNPGGPAVATTTVSMVGADCDSDHLITPTRIVGSTFSLPANGNAKIKITRDVHAEFFQAYFQYQRIVNGSDTRKIHRITTMDPILNQNIIMDEQRNLNWYAMVAADVNMNGHVRANDISLVQERIVGKLKYFPQVWNNGLEPYALDWRFVDQTTVLSNGSFRKSSTFPESDGIGFHRESTPKIPLCLDARKTCDGQSPEVYYGIMLGDTYRGSEARAPGTNPYLRTSVAPSSLTVDAKHAQYLGNNIYRVPVMHHYAYEYADNLFAIDMYMNYDQQKIRVNNVLYTTVTTDGGTSMVWNNADDDHFILTSYATLDSIAANGICYYLDIEKYTDEPFKKADFGMLQFLLNGELVEAKIETGETITGTTDGQSSIKPHVTVVPNPASGAAMIDFAVSNNSNDNRIIITDVLGRLVKSFEHVENFGMLDFNTEDLAAGMYIITLKGENGFGLSEKFQVRK